MTVYTSKLLEEDLTWTVSNVAKGITPPVAGISKDNRMIEYKFIFEL